MVAEVSCDGSHFNIIPRRFRPGLSRSTTRRLILIIGVRWLLLVWRRAIKYLPIRISTLQEIKHMCLEDIVFGCLRHICVECTCLTTMVPPSLLFKFCTPNITNLQREGVGLDKGGRVSSGFRRRLRARKVHFITYNYCSHRNKMGGGLLTTRVVYCSIWWKPGDGGTSSQ